MRNIWLYLNDFMVPLHKTLIIIIIAVKYVFGHTVNLPIKRTNVHTYIELYGRFMYVYKWHVGLQIGLIYT